MSSDLTFLTNEPGMTLSDRFSVLLKEDTRFFDCLVGYFFISGFHKLSSALEGVERVRILVGLKTDRPVYDLLQQAQIQLDLGMQSHASAKEQIVSGILEELESSPESMAVEAGVRKFVEWVRSGKLQVRAYPTATLHAKLYIMTFSEGDRDKGRVITGSSNLSQSGLHVNLEFNVELKNRSDYDYALGKFEQLWAVSVDVSKPFEEAIVNDSPFANFTPYELYLKFLYEYFQSELNTSAELSDTYVPNGFKKLKYQEDAVLSARKILDEYGGVFLSDVVGLGKTYMSALLAQQLDGRCLVIAPPNLLDMNKRGSWPNVFGDFQVRQTDFVSIGKLEDLLSRDLSKYTNVFIDESHRFRTETTSTYEMLAQICRGKRVILVSAIPLNNRPHDILSQVKLFQNGKNSNIPNLRNLEAFFAKLDKRLDGLDRQLDRERYFAAVQLNSKEAREKVLKYLMIRRTRAEIEKYYGDDMKSQGLRFPDVEDPEPVFYRFSKHESDVFDETIRLLGTEFKYTRYTPLTYFEGQASGRELQGQRNLARFMKVLIVKRLESSFHAFRLTLDRFIESYQRVSLEYKKGYVYIGNKYIAKLLDLLENEDDAAVDQLLEDTKLDRLPASQFSAAFAKDLKSDLAILLRIRDLWAGVRRDPKWDALRVLLTENERLKSNRLILFTESQETATYLGERIAKEVDKKVIVFTGSSDEAAHRQVIANFDANAFERRDDFRILISTEVLSEGVNLHRSNIVMNYDIPWNPTRLIQRVGRVNRLDTKFTRIYTYNFFPTEQTNDLIKLREAAEAKIHAFIEMLGSDARLLTDGEEIKSHEFFAKLTSRELITGEGSDEDSELEYLKEIREVRDERPDLFLRIKRLPKRARSTRSFPIWSDSPLGPLPALLTYFRQGRLDKFYLGNESTGASNELDFLTAARFLKPLEQSETRSEIGALFYALLEKNKDAFAAATTFTAEDTPTRRGGGSNDAYIIKRLKAKEIRNYHGFTEDDDVFLQQIAQLLGDGALPRPTTKKVADSLRHESEPLRVLGILRRDIPRAFLQPMRSQILHNALSVREVILSSLLVQHA
jgi:superfamily II DNA or RNA helicase